MFYRINEERFHLRWRAQVRTESFFRVHSIVVLTRAEHAAPSLLCRGPVQPASRRRTRYHPGYRHDSDRQHVGTSLQCAPPFGLVCAGAGNADPTDTQTGPISLHEINTYYDRLADKPDLSHTLAKHKSDHSWPPKRERAGDFILATCEVLSGLDRWGLSTQETFLQQQGESTHAKWVVDWSSLGKAMKRSLVEAIIRDKLGEKAIRCWRILEAKGKLEEKHVRP